MGALAQQTIQRLEASNELRVNAGVISMDDTKVKMIENLLSRSELEMKGYDGIEISNEEVMGKTIDAKVSMDEADKQISLDDLSRFTDRQLEDFDRTIREVEYGDIDLLRHLQNTTIPRGATQHTFPLTDLQGKYKRITGSAKDLPTSHISGEEHTIKVEMGGGSLEWNIQEMDAANFANIPYEAEKARAVRRAYLQDIYDITIRGNDNLEGLMSTDIDSAAVADTVDNPNTVAGAALKYWINKTGREIVEDLADARIAIHSGTEGRWGGPFIDDGLEGNRASFTCLLPLDSMNALYKVYMNTSAGGSSPQTTWAYLNSPQGRAATGITNYKVALDFDSAFQSDTAAGFMLLPNDPNAYSFVKAAELTPLPVQFQGLSMIIPYYDYFAGLKLIRNKALVRRYSIQAP